MWSQKLSNAQKQLRWYETPQASKEVNFWYTLAI